ncbi:secreted RxLR effector peptide protein, putative [Phytophthora infestans T30-4]|uniref:RxLR effector protein n=1 Tax=Phytophthora infestans (strain T30-4) TaxID=403677 RepID=D0N0N9_PHYIT|nr:secreted RxLR effector peptide protein, putative [Phytophthora infestans T30-4]EEY67202.1 secreted RxLR effector peptide protein, putative [Phytophthora infestans T30-4]KAI9985041.1 hypothetical protein PInf_004349 [Phytophthora infestans]|eukprot:XP_002905850.1 secreted RxLR effector peptide protein, putative [Phytophthora infestans T30-4]
MRSTYALLFTATILLACSDVLSAVADKDTSKLDKAPAPTSILLAPSIEAAVGMRLLRSNRMDDIVDHSVGDDDHESDIDGEERGGTLRIPNQRIRKWLSKDLTPNKVKAKLSISSHTATDSEIYKLYQSYLASQARAYHSVNHF